VSAMPDRLEVCARVLDARRCLGVLYRPQPDLVYCRACGSPEPGIVYVKAALEGGEE
jgi:hypothetical protein